MNSGFDKTKTVQNVRVICVLISIATLFTAFACWISIHIGYKFYEIYPFHFDSASYLFQNFLAYIALYKDGFWQQIITLLHTKDSLDIILQTIFFPNALQKLFGHMMVLIPLMGAFFSLLSYYVYKRSKNYLNVFLALIVFFIFPYIYSPYMGISDYWKGNLAIWWLGLFIISLLLSNNFQKRAWSVFSGICFGLLFWQKSAMGIYFSILLAPYVIFWFFLERTMPYKSKFLKLLSFFLPVCILLIPLIIFQGYYLYRYYFVGGYSYGDTYQTFLFILSQITRYISTPFFVSFFSTVICIFLGKKKNLQDCIISLWFLIGFLVLLIALKTLYYEFPNVVWLLSTIAFATAISSFIKPNNFFQNSLSTIFFVLFASLAVNNLLVFWNTPGFYISYEKKWQKIYDEILAICRENQCKHLTVLTSQKIVPMLMQAFYVDHMKILEPGGISPVGYMAVHDAFFVNKTELNLKSTPEQIYDFAKSNLRKAYNSKNPIVVTFCNKQTALKSQAFQIDAKRIALPYAIDNMEIAQKSPCWQILKNIHTPDGCVSVYKKKLS